MIALAGALLLAAPAAEPVRFTGATIGLSAHGGAAILNDDRVQGRTGFVAGVAGRLTSALFLGDVEIAYTASRFAASVAGGPLGITRHSFSATLGLHPLFILTLGNRRLHYILGSFHVLVGFSLEVTSASLDGRSRARGDPAWHLGIGFDIPVTDPNEGRGLWLGLRFRQIRLGTDIVRPFATELGDLQLFVTLAYRWNWK